MKHSKRHRHIPKVAIQNGDGRGSAFQDASQAFVGHGEVGIV
jgi:hypothetical protein